MRYARHGRGMYLSVDDRGDQAVRTKHSHPYSYDPITLYINSVVKPTGTIYTDRLLQWDRSKHDSLCEKHFGDSGQLWDARRPEKIEAFLRDWCEDQGLQLCAVIEYCNAASGYPTWRLDYYQEQSDRNPSGPNAVELAAELPE